MWSCFKPQNEKNTEASNDRYSPSSELLEQRIGQLERDAVKSRQHLDYLNTNVTALHLHTPSSITQKVEQTGGVRFERLPSNPTIQRASSTSTNVSKLERKFRRLDPHFDSYEGPEGI